MTLEQGNLVKAKFFEKVRRAFVSTTFEEDSKNVYKITIDDLEPYSYNFIENSIEAGSDEAMHKRIENSLQNMLNQLIEEAVD